MTDGTWEAHGGASGRGGSNLRELRGRILGRLGTGLVQRSTRYGLRRDLEVPLVAPKALIPIEIRPMREEDLDVLFPLDDPERSPRDTADAMWRRGFARRRIEGCHVAVDLRDGKACFMLWLVGPEERDFVAGLDGFPPLAPDEALLENAYVPPSHRNLGIMPEAGCRIAELAAGLGCRYVVSYVDVDNRASLKGCWRAGFRPFQVHHATRYAFRTFARHRYVPLAHDDPRREPFPNRPARPTAAVV